MAEKYEDHGLFRSPPEKVGGIRGALIQVYNPVDKSIFGRTVDSWVKIIVFYLVFYAVLSVLFGLSYWVFKQTLDPRIPKWQLSKSIIGTNPGLGYRPMPPNNSIESSLIYYKGTRREDYQFWFDSLTEYLQVYKVPGTNTPGRGQNIDNCDYDNYPKPGHVCDVSIRNWFPCTQENEYNYHKSGPCIFLKLNKIYGWRPEYYNSTRDLPHNMPHLLKKQIEVVEKTKPKSHMNTVWVSCEGENPADIENLGTLHYIPLPGFPGYYFPYENSEGYLSPIMAVHIERPKNGILINIQCKAWAKNIFHSSKEKTGMVHFELMVD